MNKLILAAGLFALAPMLSQPADAAGRGARGELVYQVVKKWAPHVQEAYRADMGTWAQNMGPTFAKASMDQLQRAADADSFDAMNSALTPQSGVAKAKADVSPMALGDPATDLVFVPVSPCRLFDTRLAGGAIAANTVRSFDVTAVSDYSFQGGSASNCNGAGAAGSFAAAVINLTVVTPSGAGYITAFPFGGTQPLSSNVNYTAGAIVANLATVALDQGASANEMSVYTFAQTHLIGDIVGYFINPQATALQCVEVDGSVLNLAAGAAGNAFAGTCPAGYTAVETQCRPSIFGMRVAGSWTSHCNMVNDSASAGTVTATARCCRVPGR
ncbi:hypothetical protein LVB77_15485 [Lysobacter sp. 5GHs7-4]|uniref:hypothetical protein n=1 Tax=Lysobacter sp. 5GHs7-4 TaxID=2904253 RepID=UPI001E5D0CC9|nr:hypothetical protein [Lysobacter sp. 5GHs7-4]UHQ22063.1 hypothetical protein LVB77_15485 [Lysobacter sp. 5GHs7-4]